MRGEEVTGVGGKVQDVERGGQIAEDGMKITQQLRYDRCMEGVVEVEDTGRGGHDDGSGIVTENAGWGEWVRLGVLPVGEVLGGSAGEGGIEFDTENAPEG